jgi:RNA-directed DNA polymerase
MKISRVVMHQLMQRSVIYYNRSDKDDRDEHPGHSPQGGATFDFLGFTLHWQRTRWGAWRVAFRTRSARLGRAIKAAAEWCRRHRHDSVKEQHKALTRKLEGHYNYFGVNGNGRALQYLRYAVTRAWRKWLNRRSQRARMNWKRFNELLQAHPLPAARIKVQIWHTL